MGFVVLVCHQAGADHAGAIRRRHRIHVVVDDAAQHARRDPASAEAVFDAVTQERRDGRRVGRPGETKRRCSGHRVRADYFTVTSNATVFAGAPVL